MDEFLLNIYNNTPGLKETGSFDQFKESMSTTSNRKMMYDGVPELQGIGSFDQFEEAFQKSAGTMNMPNGSPITPMGDRKQKEEGQENDLLDLGFLNDTWLGDTVQDLYRAGVRGYEQGAGVGESLEVLVRGASATDENITDLISAVEAQQKPGISDEMKNFMDAKGFKNSMMAFLENPVSIIAETVVESAMAMGRSGGVAIAGSAMTGPGAVALVPLSLGATSAALETSGKMVESLQEVIAERGMEFNKESIRAVMEDEDVWGEIRNKAITKGAVIGIVDAATAGLVSKIGGNRLLTRLANKSKAGQQITSGMVKSSQRLTNAGEFALEASAGGLGELAGQASVGEEADFKSAALEIFGEIPGGAISVASSNVINKKRLGNLNQEHMAAAVQNDDRPTFEAHVNVAKDLGHINEDQATELLESYDEFAKINASIPDKVSDKERRAKITGLIRDRNLLDEVIRANAEKEVDEVFASDKEKEVEKLNKKREQLNEKIQETVKQPKIVTPNVVEDKTLDITDDTQPSVNLKDRRIETPETLSQQTANFFSSFGDIIDPTLESVRSELGTNPSQDDLLSARNRMMESDDEGTRNAATRLPTKAADFVTDVTEEDLAIEAEMNKHKSSFGLHIESSIPTFKDSQVKKARAISKVISDNAVVYDLGGSEGSLIKSIAKTTKAKGVKFVNLDASKSMKNTFDKTPVEGTEFIAEAFGEGFDDNGTVYETHVPKEKADVVHESMLFQFISPDREAQVKEIKDNYLKDDGILILEEKVFNKNWKANEDNKNKNWKPQHFSETDIALKEKQVGVTGDEIVESVDDTGQVVQSPKNITGMNAGVITDNELRSLLEKNFSTVEEYWDGGNFKGYVASNSSAKVKSFMDALGGPVRSQFSNQESVVPTTASISEFKSEKTLPSALNKDGYAILTASQEGPNGTIDTSQNETLKNELIEEFGQENVEEIKGTYNGVDQGPSFIVTGISEQRARAIGSKYKQESIITKKGLVYSDTGDVNPNKGDVIVGEKARSQPYQSIVIGKDGKEIPFTMDIDFDTTIKADEQNIPDTEVAQPAEKRLERDLADVQTKLKDNQKELNDTKLGRTVTAELAEFDTDKKPTTEAARIKQRFVKYLDDGATLTSALTKLRKFVGDRNLTTKDLPNQLSEDIKKKLVSLANSRAKLIKQETSIKDSIVERNTEQEKIDQAAEKEIADELDKLFGEQISSKDTSIVLNALKSIDPEVVIQIHDTDEAYTKATGDGLGRAQWDPATKTIHINRSKSGKKELYHEAAHVVYTKLFAGQPDRLVEWADAIRDVLANGNQAEKAIAEALDDFTSRYEQQHADAAGDVTLEQLRAEEFFVELTAMIADNKAALTPRAEKGIIESIKQLLSRLFGIDTKAVSNIDDVIELLNTIATGLREGDLGELADNINGPDPDQGAGGAAASGIRYSMEKIPDVIANNPVAIQNIISFADQSSFNNSREFKDAIERLFKEHLPEIKKQYGKDIDLTKFNEISKKYMSDSLLSEALVAINSFPEAIGWYDLVLTKSFNTLSILHPELSTDPAADQVFKIALAITSNGMKVDSNFDYANNQYDYFKKNGRFEEVGFGTARGAMIANFKILNSLLDAGVDILSISSFLNTKMKAGNLNLSANQAKNLGIGDKAINFSGKELATEDVFGALIFGPKIGNGFYMNLNGEYNQLTIDRWFMRMWGRVSGKLVEVNPQKIKDTLTKFTSTLAAVKKDKDAFAKLKDLIPNIKSMKIQDAQDSLQKLFMKSDLRVILENDPILNQLRLASNSYNTALNGDIEAPSNGSQLKFIRDVFTDIKSRLLKDNGIDITMSDLQAVLWYPEKILYESFQKNRDFKSQSQKFKEDEGAPDYYNAAIKLLKKLGITDEQIKKQSGRTTSESGSGGARPNDQPGSRTNGENNQTLDESEAERIERIRQNIFRVKNEISKTKHEVKGKRLSIYGEKGAAALDKAEEASIRMDNLDVAKQMEKDGSSPQLILEGTGWQKGVDNLWRYEVDPDAAALSSILDIVWKNLKGKNAFLELTAAETFGEDFVTAYPELSDLKVEFNNKPNPPQGLKGNYSPVNKVITVYLTNALSPTNTFSPVSAIQTIVHEKQHAIQNIEGFETGGTPELAARKISMERAGSSSFKDTITLAKAMVDELSNLEPVTEIPDGYEVAFIESKGLWGAVDKSTGKPPSAATFSFDKEKAVERSLTYFTGKKREEFQKEIDRLTKIDFKEAYEKYRNFAGEIEARNVEKRLALSPSVRRKTLLEATEGVSREDQGFIRDSIKGILDMSMSLETAANQVEPEPTPKRLSLDEPTKNKIKQVLSKVPLVSNDKLAAMLNARGIQVTPDEIGLIRVEMAAKAVPQTQSQTAPQKQPTPAAIQAQKVGASAPGQGSQNSAVNNLLSLQPINEVVREIRSKLLNRTGPTGPLVGSTTVEAVIFEAAQNHITTDGTFSRESVLAHKVIAGTHIPDAAETIALGYAALRLQDRRLQELTAYEKSKSQNHPDQGTYYQRLSNTETQLEGYLKAIEIAGSRTGLAFRMRQEVLTFDRFSETGIAKMYERAMPVGENLTDADKRKIAKDAEEIRKKQQEVQELMDKKKEHGDSAKESIAESEVKNIKNKMSGKGKDSAKTAGGKIRQSKNLDAARNQLNDVLKGKIC